MNTYLILLRGINVGGKNKIPMAELKVFLEELGCTNVTPYIQSGNVIVKSPLSAQSLGQKVEENLIKKFKFDSTLIKTLVLTKKELKDIINNRPKGFGDKPDIYHSDTIFLMGITATDAMNVFKPLEGVDTVWPGDAVIYSQRLSAQRTKSRLNRIVGTVPYQSMTIRNWNTTTKLLEMMEKMEE